MRLLLSLSLLLPLRAFADPPAVETASSIQADAAAPAQDTSARTGFFSRLFENFYQAPDAYSITNVARGLSTHRPMFVLPYSYSPEYHGKHAEVVFQISAKQKLFGSDFYFGYTQRSYWQLFNSAASSPFRETDYNPELFYRWIPKVDWLQDWGADIGIEHESNGRSLPDSRSWNRAYLAPFLVRGKTLYYLKTWYRLPERAKTSPTDAEGDDNPDIQRYVGYGELQIQRQLFDNHLLHVKLRGNPSTGRAGLGINYSIPSSDGSVFYCVDLFSGYGETLIDYNRHITRIGIGVMMAR